MRATLSSTSSRSSWKVASSMLLARTADPLAGRLWPARMRARRRRPLCPARRARPWPGDAPARAASRAARARTNSPARSRNPCRLACCSAASPGASRARPRRSQQLDQLEHEHVGASACPLLRPRCGATSAKRAIRSRASGGTCGDSLAAVRPATRSSLRRRATWITRARCAWRSSIGGRASARTTAAASCGSTSRRTQASTSRTSARRRKARSPGVLAPAVCGGGLGRGARGGHPPRIRARGEMATGPSQRRGLRDPYGPLSWPGYALVSGRRSIGAQRSASASGWQDRRRPAGCRRLRCSRARTSSRGA